MRREKDPFWARREFQWFVGSVLVGAALVLVVLFEIRPALEESRRARSKELEDVVRAKEAAELGPAPHAAGLEGAKDGTPLGQTGPEYGLLYRRLKEVPPEEIAKEARPVEYTLLKDEPARFRGRVIRIIALLTALDHVPVDIVPGDVAWVWRAYLLDPSGDEGYVVDLIEEPAADLPPPRSWSLVAAEGVFLRIGTFEPMVARDGEVKKTPHLLARRLSRFEERTRSEQWEDHTFFLGGGLLFIVTILLGAWIALGFLTRKAAGPRPVLPGAAAGAPAALRKKTAPWKREQLRAAAWKLIPRPPGGPVLRRRTSQAPARSLRRLLLHVGVFALIAGVVILVKLEPWERRGPPSAEESLAEAEERWREIRDVERKVEEGAASLSREEAAVIRKGLGGLADASDAVHARLESLQAGRLGTGEEAMDLGRRLLELKLWVLDADAVLEAVESGSPLAAAGFFIPLQAAMAKERKAEDELKAIEAAKASGAGGEEWRTRAAAVKTALEECRALFRGLAARAREGLTREDLTGAQLAFLRTVEAEEARAAEALERAEQVGR